MIWLNHQAANHQAAIHQCSTIEHAYPGPCFSDRIKPLQLFSLQNLHDCLSSLQTQNSKLIKMAANQTRAQRPQHDIDLKSSLGFCCFSAFVYNLPLESDVFTRAEEYSGGRCEVWTRSAGIEVGGSAKNP